MTASEAIENLKKLKSYHNGSYGSSINMAIEALEKQTPKKPKKYIAFDGIERNGCPSCPRNEILYARQKYCAVCGQAIDWSEE